MSADAGITLTIAAGGRADLELLSRSPAALAAALEPLRAARRETLAGALPRAEEAYRSLAGDEELPKAVRAFRKRGTA